MRTNIVYILKQHLAPKPNALLCPSWWQQQPLGLEFYIATEQRSQTPVLETQFPDMFRYVSLSNKSPNQIIYPLSMQSGSTESRYLPNYMFWL